MSPRLLIVSLFLAALAGMALGQVSTTDDQPTSEDAAPPIEESTAEEDAELAAEDAAVDQVLKDAELIYGDDDKDFIPSQNVSADQSLDYPVDI
ncbi:MAG: hypothetical protein AAGJ86_07370 [Pseudomonadota bacterium]